MVEGGCGLSLALKTSERLRVAGDFFGQKFEGDEAAQASVFGLVDNTHATASELFDDAIVGDVLADHQGQSLRGEGGQVNESGGIES
jgi:hypothetical protein